MARSWRSALVPGWGQYYDGATTKGLVFLLGSLATGAAALEFNHEYYTPRLNRYNNAREAYLNATTESDIVQYREDMNIKYSDLDKARNTRNILIAATAGFYTLNLLDAVLFHSRGSEISVLAEGKGVQLLPDVSYSQSGIHYGLQVRF